LELAKRQTQPTDAQAELHAGTMKQCSKHRKVCETIFVQVYRAWQRTLQSRKGSDKFKPEGRKNVPLGHQCEQELGNGRALDGKICISPPLAMTRLKKVPRTLEEHNKTKRKAEQKTKKKGGIQNISLKKPAD